MRWFGVLLLSIFIWYVACLLIGFVVGFFGSDEMKMMLLDSDSSTYLYIGSYFIISYLVFKVTKTKLFF